VTAHEDDARQTPLTEAGRRLRDKRDNHAERCHVRDGTPGPSECSCGLDQDVLAIEAEARVQCESELAALVEATENLRRAAQIHWRPVQTRHRWLDDLLRADTAIQKLVIRGGLSAAAAERDARLRAGAVGAERDRLRRALLAGDSELDESEATRRHRRITVDDVLALLAPSPEADHD
jgi:hypothetical protein